MAIITIEDLLRNKSELEQKKNRTVKVFVEELGGEIELKVPSVTEIMEILDKKVSNIEQADEIIYYNCISPKLNDNILISNLKCSNNPVKVVEKVMSEHARMNVSTLLINASMGNQGIVKIADDIKNS